MVWYPQNYLPNRNTPFPSQMFEPVSKVNQWHWEVPLQSVQDWRIPFIEIHPLFFGALFFCTRVLICSCTHPFNQHLRRTWACFSLRFLQLNPAYDKISDTTILPSLANNQETTGNGLHSPGKMKKLTSRMGFGAWRGSGKKERNSWKDALQSQNRNAERSQQISIC